MLGEAIKATPWIIPGVVFVLVVSMLVNQRLAAVLRSPRAVAFLLTVAFGVVVVVTLTPSLDGGMWGRSGVVNLDYHRLSLRDLATVNERSLNVALFVPLALAAALIARRGARLVVLVLVWAMPVVIESVQYAVPELGRSGFVLDDVIANMVGVAVGSLLGMVARRVAFSGARVAT